MRLLDERAEILRAQLQVGVESGGEMRAEPYVEEQSRSREDDGHRERERRGDSRTDRQPTHAPSPVRSR